MLIYIYLYYMEKQPNFEEWFEEARKNGSQFIISVCDTFDWGDYPVYCKDAKELLRNIPSYDDVDMQKINEVIRIHSTPGIEERYFDYSKLLTEK